MILHHDTNHTENWCDERLHSVKYSRETPAQAFQMQKDEKCTPCEHKSKQMQNVYVSNTKRFQSKLCFLGLEVHLMVTDKLIKSIK